MNKKIVRMLVLTLALCAGVILSSTVQAAPADLPAQQTNLLKNAGFEFPYNSDGAASEWIRWHQNSSEDQFDDCTNGYHKLPNWSAETVSSGLIHNGAASQHIGLQWGTWHAGVWQNVSVTPGSTYRFTVHANGRGSNNNYPAASETGLQMNVRVGIDPNGSGVWHDGDVAWSGTINPHDSWQAVSKEVTAVGNTITVFTSANWGVQGVDQCRLHLDVWFDSAELIEVGPPPTNTPPPQPTLPPATLAPLATNTPTAVPATATPEIPPTETAVPPTATPETPPGGTICVNAFADNNSNGVRDNTEGYMGNVTFTVASANAVVGQAVSTGTPNPFCFEGLEPGSYQVAQIVPGRLEMTTAGNAAIQVEEGQRVGVEFGSRIRLDDGTTTNPPAAEVADVNTGTTDVSAAETDNEAPAAEDDGFNIANISGLLVMILAVILLGVLFFLLLRRSA
ncbi:MAG: hypothetical protein GY943_10200 [Chloroflexi bacterium]|nr:hypothetical protein [Chloroflexota bacterium]